MTDDAPGDALRLIEGPELDDLVGERRKCSACGADDMRAVRFEETANNFYLTFQCPHCDNSVLIESPGMAGVRAALYFLIGAAYLAALKLFDIEIGATGVAIFSIVAVIAVCPAHQPDPVRCREGHRRGAAAAHPYRRPRALSQVRQLLGRFPCRPRGHRRGHPGCRRGVPAVRGVRGV